MQHTIFKKSNIGFIFVNRQTFDDYEYVDPVNEYNRVAGLDYNYFSKSNKWTGNSYFHKSFTKGTGNNDYSFGGKLNYNSRKFLSETSFRYIGEDFKADLGFIKRTNNMAVNYKTGPLFYPKNENINTVGLFFKTTGEFAADSGENLDHNFGGLFFVDFINQSSARLEAQYQYTYVTQPFDPLNKDGEGTEIGIGDYNYAYFFTKYNSNKTKLFYYSALIHLGSYYNGYKYTGEFELNYRVQPIFNTTLVANVDYIDLPYGQDAIYYIGPRFEFTFTKSIFWTTDIQSNSQDNTFGINSRLQWRYKPLSDLFLIYTSGYRTGEETQPLSKGIFLKGTFWLNI